MWALTAFRPQENMIVTEERKNIYPEDIEAAFESLAVKEFAFSPPTTFGQTIDGR